MADVALGIDVLLDAAQVLGQFLADGQLLLVLLDFDFTGFDYLLGCLLYLTLLFISEVHTLKVDLQLAGIIGSLALLAHPAP